MPGTFAVIGTLSLLDKGLLAYGDVVTGDVCAGELLVIPLNGSTSMTAVIRSVEAVDGTATGSHVGLLLTEDRLESDILWSLAFEGETLAISAAEADLHDGRMGFEEARQRLVDLLGRVQWPQRIVWIDASHLISLPGRVFLFLPGDQFDPEHMARVKYESASAQCPAMRLGAVGISRGRTVAAVWQIDSLSQGEEMFIDHGVKVDVPATKPVVTTTRSRMRWWWIRHAYRKWIERRDAALALGEQARGHRSGRTRHS